MTTTASLRDPASAFRLDGDVAAITGGASGIGRAVAETFAAAGATVVILDRDAENARIVAQDIGESALAISVDVTDEPALETAFARIVEQYGKLDILYNNAGIGRVMPSVDLPLADWEAVVAVNMTGVFLCGRIATRHMLASGGGRIVNAASVLGMSGGWIYPNISYHATKGAVVNMTRAWAIEWAPHNIRVNAVAPAWVRTPFIQRLLDSPELVKQMEGLIPLGRLAEPADIVGAVQYLASHASDMVTGHILPIDGGMLAQ